MSQLSKQPRTILHIGSPKTGSTSLQEQVFPELGSICFMGKRWWNPEVPYDKCVALHRAIDSVTKAGPADYDHEAAALAVREWLEHAPKAQPQADGSYLPRLLSEERLTFTDVVGMDEVARRLAALFPGAEIVFVRREQVSGLRSYHRWLYSRAWTGKRFSAWLTEGFDQALPSHAAVAVRSYDWGLIEDSFGAYFPKVRSVEFAQMKRDPAAYLAALIGIEAAEFSDFAWLAEKPLNVSRGAAAAELHHISKKLIRFWNCLPFGKIDEKPEYIGDTPLWRRLERIVSLLPISEDRFKASEDDRRRISAYYARQDMPPAAIEGTTFETQG